MNIQNPIHLFCLPSAGSSASIYRAWESQAPDFLKVIALEYPGHGRKIKESLVNDPDVLAELLIKEIEKKPNEKFILLGHSVGASLIWRIEHKLRQHQHYKNLLMLVVSSRPAPMYLNKMRRFAGLNQDEVIQELKGYNNFPEEILNNQSALDFFMPIVKNDFLLSDRMLNDEILMTEKPLMSLYGKADPYLPSHEILDSWKHFSTQWMGCYALEGDHFYFLDAQILTQTMACIVDNVEQLVKTQALENHVEANVNE